MVRAWRTEILTGHCSLFVLSLAVPSLSSSALPSPVNQCQTVTQKLGINRRLTPNIASKANKDTHTITAGIKYSIMQAKIKAFRHE